MSFWKGIILKRNLHSYCQQISFAVLESDTQASDGLCGDAKLSKIVKHRKANIETGNFGIKDDELASKQKSFIGPNPAGGQCLKIIIADNIRKF